MFGEPSGWSSSSMTLVRVLIFPIHVTVNLTIRSHLTDRQVGELQPPVSSPSQLLKLWWYNRKNPAIRSWRKRRPPPCFAGVVAT